MGGGQKPRRSARPKLYRAQWPAGQNTDKSDSDLSAHLRARTSGTESALHLCCADSKGSTRPSFPEESCSSRGSWGWRTCSTSPAATPRAGCKRRPGIGQDGSSYHEVYAPIMGEVKGKQLRGKFFRSGIETARIALEYLRSRPSMLIQARIPFTTLPCTSVSR